MKSDVIIIGGGIVGLTFANVIADQGILVSLVEVQDPAKQNHDKFDGRCTSVAHSSVKLFEKIGIWKGLKKYAGPIKEIYVTDTDSPVFLHFGEEETSSRAMGYMVENRYIRKALHKKITGHKNINYLAPAKYKKIEYGNHFVKVELEDGRELEAKLLVACDGRNSKIREECGIQTVNADYNQSGIVCAVEHEQEHSQVAQERFLPSGPFAILPMKDQHQSALVWTEKKELAPGFVEMSKGDFEKEVEKRFSGYLGSVKLIGDRWCYPLALTFAKKYSSKRMCLLGDSCHAIHPIAGQGLNLSWRDVDALSRLIIETKNLGLDIGGDTVLKEYQSLRKRDNLLMIAATDTLTRLFSNNVTSLKIARRTGLALVNKFPRLKKRFVTHAMGKNNGLV